MYVPNVSGECFLEGGADLCEDGFGVVAFGGGEALVAEDVLDFMHAQPVLVEERGAGVAGEVPVEVLGDAGTRGNNAEGGVGLTVGTDGGETLRGVVGAEDGEWTAREEGGQGQHERQKTWPP